MKKLNKVTCGFLWVFCLFFVAKVPVQPICESLKKYFHLQHTPPYKLWNKKERVNNILLQSHGTKKLLFLISIIITRTNPFQVLHLGMSPKHPSLTMYPGVGHSVSLMSMFLFTWPVCSSCLGTKRVSWKGWVWLEHQYKIIPCHIL